MATKKDVQKKKRARKPNAKSTKKSPGVLKTITPDDAATILERLAEENSAMRQKIEAKARDVLSDVDIDSVAAEVQFNLEFLEVEDVWDQSGSTRDGYVDPGDAAWQMFKDALQPHKDQLARYQKLSMDNELKQLIKHATDPSKEKQHSGANFYVHFSTHQNPFLIWAHSCQNPAAMTRTLRMIQSQPDQPKDVLPG